jgi:hypothetical protein
MGDFKKEHSGAVLYVSTNHTLGVIPGEGQRPEGRESRKSVDPLPSIGFANLAGDDTRTWGKLQSENLAPPPTP